MYDNKHNTVAVILAAGAGSRMGMDKTKQTLSICGKSVLRRSLEAFDSADCINSLVVVYRDGEYDFVNKECQFLKKPFTLVKGGKFRAESAKLGFESCDPAFEYVMIHDAARCLITAEEICSVAENAYICGAATASRPITDTVKRCDESGNVIDTLVRSELCSVQTPQAFSRDIYARALESFGELDESVTDDNMLAEKIGVKPRCVTTLSTNIKITAIDDISFAEYIIKKREGFLNE